MTKPANEVNASGEPNSLYTVQPEESVQASYETRGEPAEFCRLGCILSDILPGSKKR